MNGTWRSNYHSSVNVGQVSLNSLHLFYIKWQTYLIKVVNWWLDCFCELLCMMENMQTRVLGEYITTFTVINVQGEGEDHTSPWNEVHTADKFSVFDLNVQNKPTSSERNSVTVFFNLRTSNLGRHLRYVCLCWGFTAQSTMRSSRAGQLIVVLFLGWLRPSKRLTSTKRGRPRQSLTTTIGV